MRKLFRPTPIFPVGAYQTFSIAAPSKTHWRKATCAEVNCWAHRNGWKTVVDERTQQGMGQAYYIRRESKRRYREHRNEVGLTVFEFESGQACFNADTHRTRIDRPEILIVRPGDWRGNPDGPRAVRHHRRPTDWVEEFAEHQDYLSRMVQRG